MSIDLTFPERMVLLSVRQQSTTRAVMLAATAWFDVDKKGLGKLVAGRSKAFVLYELLQNAWDQNVTTVQVKLSCLTGRPESEIEVEDDDPDGFADLAHAYTLFAESGKKGHAAK